MKRVALVVLDGVGIGALPDAHWYGDEGSHSVAHAAEAVGGFTKTMLERDPALTEAALKKFGDNMFGGDFVFSVSREFVRRCRTPLLLQPGTDKPHPAETSAEIARLAPNLQIQKDWRGPTHLAESIRTVTEFLTRHTPAS